MGSSPATHPDPDDLLRRYRETGDPEALGALFDRTAPELFRVALHLSPDAALAEDALQETFLTALRSLDRHDPERRVVPWLIGILRNKVREVGRRARRGVDPDRLALTSPPSPADPARTAEVSEETAEVRRALDRLPEPYREVALLRWRHGLTPAEIADLKGASPGTIRSLLHRAAGRLRRSLGAFASILALPREPRSPRGLDVVRREILRRAPKPATAVAGAGAPTAVVLGGLIMKKTLLALAVLAIVAGVGAWIAAPGARPTPPGGSRDPGPPSAARADPAGRPEVEPAVASAPAPPGDGRAIAGRVTDVAGHPIEGARVVAWPAGDDPVESARDGTFSVPVAEDEPFFRLHVAAAGFADAIAGPLRPGAVAEVTLETADAIVGRVLAPNGRPVAGARVRALLRLDPVRIERSATSGPDGGYRLEGLPRLPSGRALTAGRFSASAEGFAPLLADGVPVPRPEAPAGTEVRHDVVLGRGGTIVGRVLEAGTGRPLDGARVFLWSEAQLPAVAGRARLSPLAEAVAAADGTFRLEHVIPRDDPLRSASVRRMELNVAAFADGCCARAERLLPPAEGATVEAVLRLPREALVTGRVLGPGGAAFPGATVWWPREGPFVPPFAEGGGDPAAKTDDRGEYRLRGVPAPGEGTAEVELIVQAGEWTGRPDATVRVRVAAGQEVRAGDVVVAAPPEEERAGATLRIVDSAGAPVWGAETTLSPQAPAPASDREGRIRIDLPAFRAGPTELVVRAPGHAPVVVTVTPSNPAPPETVVVLPDAHRLAGRVLAADGTPARGVTVTVANGAVSVDEVFPPDGSPGMIRPKGPLPRLVFLGSATTAADGTFEIGDLPDGPYHVLAFLYLGVYGGASFLPAETSALRVAASDVAADRTDLRLRLPPDRTPPTGSLAGAVVDAADATPVFAFRLKLSRGDQVGYAHGPDLAVGRFRIDRLPEGEWTVEVTADGYAPFTTAAVVRAGSVTEVRAALARGATIAGRLRLSGEGSLAGATIRLRREPDAAGAVATATIPVGADGSFRGAGFLPGRWRLDVLGKGPSEFGGPVWVPEDGAPVVVPEGADEVRADLVVTRAGILTVSAPPADAGAVVRLLAGDGRLLGEGEVGPGGSVPRLAYAALPPGGYEVRLERPGAPPAIRPARLVAGERTFVSFRDS